VSSLILSEGQNAGAFTYKYIFISSVYRECTVVHVPLTWQSNNARYLQVKWSDSCWLDRSAARS
jgi:hypothetical protein